MITLPDNREISDGFDPSMTQDDLLFLARIHCTYDHTYHQWENLINRRLVDVNAFYAEVNHRMGIIERQTELHIYSPEYRDRCVYEWWAMMNFVGLHPELYPTTSIAEQMYNPQLTPQQVDDAMQSFDDSWAD